MKRLFYYFIRNIAIIAKPLLGRNMYMTLYVFALKQRGIVFTGTPRYIDPDVYLDAEGGLNLGDNFVASTKVIILTHDYSFTAGLESIGKRPDTDIEVRLPVTIGRNCFVGAGSIILPGTSIGNNVIIGAGSVVHGNVEDNCVFAGNPAKRLCDIKEWIGRKTTKIDPKYLFKDKN